jgi:multiple sugar transport system permease protein
MATMAATPGLSTEALAGLKHRERRRFISGLLFSSPFWIGFLVFTAVPMAASVYFSFTNYGVLTAPKWVGLKNFIDLPKDAPWLHALANTVAYSVLAIPLSVGLGLLVAILLNQKVKGIGVWRTIYYLPSITPIVAYAVLWKWMLSRDYGVIKAMIGLVGIHPIDWLSDPYWIIIAFVMTSLWGVGGTMVINLAGLQSIPTDLSDAARVDGAGSVQVFWNVTWPMMTPVLFYNLIIGIVGAMQSFTFFFTLTQGWGNVSYTDVGAVYMVYLYRVAFQLYRMGYGSAMAWVLFVIILALTLILVRTSRRWVYYEGEWITGR